MPEVQHHSPQTHIVFLYIVMAFLDHLNWRFATKSFDSEKKVSAEEIQKVLEAIRMSPSSFGLQAFHVDVVTDANLKEKLKAVSWNQSQVTDCSHYLVFSARTDINERIEKYLDILSGGDAAKREGLNDFGNMMRGFAEDRKDEWLVNWGAKQAYIALGFAMAACAELEIDSCAMEGIDPLKYDEILEHPEHINTAVTLAVGYRKAGPTWEKTRFPQDDMFTNR